MAMVREVSHDGFADFLISEGLQEAFINTLKMEPHYGGWMHGRTHGFLPIESGAIAHDINHLTVLGWDQRQPFMNDTFDWPQWPALNVSDNTVINYFQSMGALGAPSRAISTAWAQVLLQLQLNLTSPHQTRWQTKGKLTKPSRYPAPTAQMRSQG